MNKLLSICGSVAVAVGISVGAGAAPAWATEARPASIGPEGRAFTSILVHQDGKPYSLVPGTAVDAKHPLLNRHWIVETVLGDRVVYPVPPDIHVSLLFQPEASGQVTLTGILICNWLTGTATVDGNTITVEGLGMTKRGCQPNDPRVEIGVLTALKGVSQYWIDDNQLTIAKPTGPGLILRPAF